MSDPSTDAVAVLRDFNAKYPAVGSDLIQLLTDLGVPLNAALDAAIAKDAPQVPLVRGWIVNEADSIVAATYKQFVASLAAAIETNGA